MIPFADGEVTVAALAARFDARPDPALRDAKVTHVAPPEGASETCLAPVLRGEYLDAAKGSAGVLLVSSALAPKLPEGRRLVHPSPLFVIAALVDPIPQRDERARAFVEIGAIVPASARIGPFAVIHAGAVVGEDARIGAHAVLHAGVVLGARVVIGDGAVVGRAGFGFAEHAGQVVRVPHRGGVVVEDDVEIGALSTVDAGVLEPTVLGRGTKLDAHVHVGHNVRLGPGTFVAAQAGFAGSVRVGSGVRVGGQAGVADHVSIGDGARLAAKAGVIADVRPGETVAGYPAVLRTTWLRATATLLRLSRPPR